VSDVIVAPETRDLAELADKLRGWVAGRMPEARDIAITGLDYPRGAGQSHETILFDLAWRENGSMHRQGCVVRIRPSGFTVFPDTLFEEQYRVMQAVGASGLVKVAEVLWFENNPAVLGQPFFVMEKVSGRVPVSIPHYSRTGFLHDANPTQRRHLWEAAVRQLAAIQLVPLDGLEFLEGPPHARRGLAQEWDKYRRFVAWLQEDEFSRREFGPVLEAAMARLESDWPGNQPEGLVWGDARIGNMMFDDNFDVVAVMDWEQPSLGGALHDLAWFSVLSETMHGPDASSIGAYLEGMGSRDETVALWEEVSGKSARDLEWYEDFANLKMSCTGVRLGQLRGGAFPMDARALARRLKLA
jgi:aminoglycoside phosphotransferase (APT) family kinase protein